MAKKYLLKIKGLNHEEQTEFIQSNLKDNISRLKVITIMFLLIEFLLLLMVLIPEINFIQSSQQPHYINFYISIILFNAVFLGLLHYMGNTVSEKRIPLYRIIISTSLMLILFWGAVLKLYSYNASVKPSLYIFILISFAAIPYFNYWEIIFVTLPSQLFITFLTLFDHSLEVDQSIQLLIDTWVFVLLAIIISLTIYNDRVQYFKKDLQLKKQNNLLKKHSEIDALTGVFNRRKLDEVMESEWKRSSRTSKPFSLLLIDLDHFKKYNDTYGHIEGDIVLRRSAAIMKNTLKRASDSIFRYGGEEFAVVLPFTGLEAAGIVAEKLRSNIEKAAIPHHDSAKGILTISVGVTASLGTKEIDFQSMYIEADKALYAAKRSGRNKVITYDT